MLDLSNEAWRTFETRGPEILGFWLSLDVQAPLARVFMISEWTPLWLWLLALVWLRGSGCGCGCGSGSGSGLQF